MRIGLYSPSRRQQEKARSRKRDLDAAPARRRKLQRRNALIPNVGGCEVLNPIRFSQLV
jgi:hypothetical protein